MSKNFIKEDMLQDYFDKHYDKHLECLTNKFSNLSKEDVEDTLLETIYNVYCKYDNNFARIIYVSVVNALINLYNHQNTQEYKTLYGDVLRLDHFDNYEWLAGELDVSLDNIINDEKEVKKEILWDKINSVLTEKQSTIIYKYLIEGVSLSDYARDNNISPQAASDCYRKALNQIKKHDDILELLQEVVYYGN